MNSHLQNIYKLEQDILKHIESGKSVSQSCIKELDSFNSLNNISESDVYDMALQAKLPKQFYSENQFGYFNLTLVDNNFFNIQIYIMNDIHTEVHNHTFTGAFKLLTGETIHKTFKWTSNSKIEEAVNFGELEEISSKHFTSGVMSEISLDTIHQILRIADVNITLILIDKKSTLHNPVNGYFLPPEIYIENHTLSDDFKRKLFALSILHDKNIDNFKVNVPIFLKERNILELFTITTRLNSYNLEVNYNDKLREYLINAALNELKKRNLYHYIDDYLKYIKVQNAKLKVLKG